MLRSRGIARNLHDHPVEAAVTRNLSIAADPVNGDRVVARRAVDLYGQLGESIVDRDRVAVLAKRDLGFLEVVKGHAADGSEVGQQAPARLFAKLGAGGRRCHVADVENDRIGIVAAATVDVEIGAAEDGYLVAFATKLDRRPGRSILNDDPVLAAVRGRIGSDDGIDRRVDQSDDVVGVSQRDIERREAREVDASFGAHGEAGDAVHIDEAGAVGDGVGPVVDGQRVIAGTGVQDQGRLDVDQRTLGPVARIANGDRIVTAAQSDLRRRRQTPNQQPIAAGPVAQRDVDLVGAVGLQHQLVVEARHQRVEDARRAGA